MRNDDGKLAASIEFIFIPHEKELGDTTERARLVIVLSEDQSDEESFWYFVSTEPDNDRIVGDLPPEMIAAWRKLCEYERKKG